MRSDRILYKIRNDPAFPEGFQLGRLRLIKPEEILKWMQAQNMQPQCDVNTIGIDFPELKSGDRFISLEEVKDMLEKKSRSWMQEAISRNLIPQPVFRYRPAPSLWSKLGIEEWIKKEKPSYVFKPGRGKLQEVFLRGKSLGKLEKVVTRKTPTRTTGTLTYKERYGWQPVGHDVRFNKRIDAADYLAQQKK